MFGLLELELACLWMEKGVDTFTLSQIPEQAELSEISQKVNRQLNGSGVVIRAVKNRAVVLKYPRRQPNPEDSQ